MRDLRTVAAETGWRLAEWGLLLGAAVALIGLVLGLIVGCLALIGWACGK